MLVAGAESRAVVSQGRQWLMSGIILVAIGIALWGFHPVLDGASWWLQGILMATVVLAGASGVRSFAQHRAWATVAAIILAVLAITVLFVPGTALLGVVPTWDSILAFRQLDVAGNRDIATQFIPAEATEGIRFLVCVGVAIVAVLMDALAQLFRAPALAGLPLLVLLLVPSFVKAEFVDPAPFALAAAAWLALIAVNASAPRAAIGVGIAAVVAGLLVPIALPSVGTPEPVAGEGSGAGFASGINPMITLGDDLRRGNPVVALTYRTNDESSQYLRMTALDDFTGEDWGPTDLPEPGEDVAAIGPVPGLEDGVALKELTTDVAVEQILSSWLPVPYAAVSIEGLEGEWTWEPDALTVRAEGASARNQQYEVASVQPQPSVEQLIASGSGPVEGMERYLALPPELPEIVGQTALAVADGAASHYEIAVALQDYFRSGDFTYSEQAPVDDGFDGSGAEALGPFLEIKSGYCVHFSSAMAAMARYLGIPSRVIVGFTPGNAYPTGEDGEFTAYRVTTDNLHAWPELYFDGIGWVRFEPTPGRGVPPAFAPRDVDDPTTPEVDESIPPAPTPIPTPTPSASAPTNLPEDVPLGPTDQALGTDAATAGFPWGSVIGAVAVLLLLTPAGLRIARRARRLAAVEHGSALDGWDELRDLAYDLGIESDVTLTPQQFSGILAPQLDDDGQAALARFRSSLESQAFAGQAASPAGRDLRRVLRSLRRGAGLPRAAGAALVPRSLVRDWLPAQSER